MHNKSVLNFELSLQNYILKQNNDIVVLQQLYQEGARVFWIHNTGPLGCLPSTLAYKLPKPGDLDQNGCWKPHNEVAEEFNRQLKDRVFKLRAQLSEAVLTYVDLYTARYTLISEAEKHGKFLPVHAYS